MSAETQNSIRIIDLSKDEKELVDEIRSACTEVGFFYVTSHNVDSDVSDRFYDSMRKFFSLTHEQKMKIPLKIFRGYYPFAAQTLDTSNLQKQPDTKEGFYCGIDVPEGSEGAKYPLVGPNQWPPEYLEFEKYVMDYYAAITPVANRVLELLALSLNCPRDRFTELFQSTPMSRLKLNHYNEVKSDAEKGIFAGGAHTDWGVITLLSTDGVPGLEVYRQSEKLWQSVPHIEGSFIVNLGNVMQRWTNDTYRSTLHRVVSTSGKERYSAAFFYDPDFMTQIKTIENCCTENQPSKYDDRTLGGLILENFNATFGTNIPDPSYTAQTSQL